VKEKLLTLFSKVIIQKFGLEVSAMNRND